MKYLVFILIMLSCAVHGTENSELVKVHEQIYEQLCAAIANKDVESFHSVCDDGMKAAINKDVLIGINKKFNKLIEGDKGGSYIGSYLKNGMTVHLFKIVKSKDLEDILVILTIDEDKCAGLLFQ